MKAVNVREARQHMSALLDAVQRGEEIIIQRRGRPVARLAPMKGSARRFPDRSALRSRIRCSSVSSVKVVRQLREEERY